MNVNLSKARLSSTKGFTLIESILAIVLMGFALSMLITLFFPQVEDSAKPHYQARASALGQSVMNTILSRGFDENSDSAGGIIRCDDTIANTALQTNAPVCVGATGKDDETRPSEFDDVDDYSACWSEPVTPGCSDLSELINNSDEYRNFTVAVKVVNHESTHPYIMKKISVTISVPRYESFEIIAYKANY
ncbi:MAG: prepilin-type N-terminal cleavage/methylation domain-containing protein [Vibrio sp.]